MTPTNLEVNLYSGNSIDSSKKITNLFYDSNTITRTNFKGYLQFLFIRPMGENTYTVSASTSSIINDPTTTITKTANVEFSDTIFEETIYVGNYSTFIKTCIESIKGVLVGKGIVLGQKSELKPITDLIGMTFMMHVWWKFVACSILFIVISYPTPNQQKLKWQHALN